MRGMKFKQVFRPVLYRSTSSAAVDNDVRVVIKSGITKQQAHLALLAISNTLIGDQIILD
jgi:hypothetical protein